MENLKIINFPVEYHPERLILLSGAGQNVGKTTFACQLIQHFKLLNQKVFALKICPHFHSENPPRIIFSDERFILSLEDKKESGKDSSRMLAAGADESFFLQVKDEHLEAAFSYAISLMPSDILVVIESGALRSLLIPSIYFFLMRKNMEIVKEGAKRNRNLADKVVIFEDHKFDFQMESIQISDGQIYLID